MDDSEAFIPNEPFERFKERYVKPAAGRTLIVGSRLFSAREDRRKLYPDVLGVDMEAGEGVDRVLDLEERLPADLGKFAHVECLSVLEHARRPWLLAANLQRLLIPGGTLFLSAPFVWRFHSYPNDYFRFTAEGIRSLFPAIEWVRLCYASNRLSGKTYLKAYTHDGHPYLPRTEVAGFGVRA